MWHIQLRLHQIANGGRDNIAVIINKRSKMGIEINGVRMTKFSLGSLKAVFTDGVERGLPIEWMMGHFRGLEIVQIKTMHSATCRRCRLAATICKYSDEDGDAADGRTDHNRKPHC